MKPQDVGVGVKGLPIISVDSKSKIKFQSLVQKRPSLSVFSKLRISFLKGQGNYSLMKDTSIRTFKRLWAGQWRRWPP